jgi:DNA-binding MarR family transcriptional regulator
MSSDRSSQDPDRPEVDPGLLDLGYLALFVGLAYGDSVQAELKKAHPDVRYAHGFLIQHLVGAERTIGELAERMEITQQGVSKSVAELEGLGYLERKVDPSDARARRIGLSKRGKQLIAETRRRRAAIEHRLEVTHGKHKLARLRSELAEVLDSLGGSEAVRQRRVRFDR